MKVLSTILLGLLTALAAAQDSAGPVAPPPIPEWVEELWNDHLLWRTAQPHDRENDLELVCRDLLRQDPVQARAVERLGLHYAAQKEYALMGMAALYGHFLQPGNPRFLERWSQAVAAVVDFPQHPPLNTENLPESTFYLQRLADARRFLEDGDYVACENALRALLVRYPANQEILADLGSLYVIKNEWALCAMLARYAFQLYPEDANFLNNHVLALERIGYPELAFEVLTENMRQHPEAAYLDETRGRLALGLERPQVAVRAFAAWTKKEPLSARAWESYGLSLIETGELVFAKVAFKKALEYAPAEARPWYYLAKISVLEANEEQARKDLRNLSSRVSRSTFRAWLGHLPLASMPALQAEFSTPPGTPGEAP